jgi:hypothetical protein
MSGASSKGPLKAAGPAETLFASAPSLARAFGGFRDSAGVWPQGQSQTTVLPEWFCGGGSDGHAMLDAKPGERFHRPLGLVWHSVERGGTCLDCFERDVTRFQRESAEPAGGSAHRDA